MIDRALGIILMLFILTLASQPGDFLCHISQVRRTQREETEENIKPFIVTDHYQSVIRTPEGVRGQSHRSEA